MSQGGSRRPYSRGGQRWPNRYKEYWDYDHNYSDGSSAGSPKEALLPTSPPPAPAGVPPPAKRDVRDMRHTHHQEHQRRMSIGNGAGGSRRTERRAAGPSERRRPERWGSPGSAAGPSHSPAPHHAYPHPAHPHPAHPHPAHPHPAHPHPAHHAHAPYPHQQQHQQQYPPHHNMDTNPLQAPEPPCRLAEAEGAGGGGGVGGGGGGGGGSSDGELSSKHGDSPSRKRRRVSRHRHTEANATVAPPPVERRTPRHHYQPPRRMRYVNSNVWAHDTRLLEPHTPLLLDINPMSLRGARLGVNTLGAGVAWPHREHPPRTQMGGVYAGLQLAGGFAPRGPFASPTHSHAHHHHFIPHTQRVEPARVDVLAGEGAVSPLQPELHHAPLLLATEARGAALELLAPQHARHALQHTHHHLHRRNNGVGGVSGVGVVGGVGGAGTRPGAPLPPPAALAPPPALAHASRERRHGRCGRGAAARRAALRARAARRAAVAAAAAAHLPGVPEPAGHVPAVPVRGGPRRRGGRGVPRDRELRGAAVAGREARGGQAEGPPAAGDRLAAQLQVLPADAPGRADVVRGVHVRVRGAPDAARAALRARVPRQVRRQVAPV